MIRLVTLLYTAIINTMSKFDVILSLPRDIPDNDSGLPRYRKTDHDTKRALTRHQKTNPGQREPFKTPSN